MCSSNSEKQLLAGLLVRIQMLETKENRWNVIPRFVIQLDVLDPCLTEGELRCPCLSQLMSVVRRLPTMGGLGRKFLLKLPDIEILRNLESSFILWIQTDIHFLANTIYPRNLPNPSDSIQCRPAR